MTGDTGEFFNDVRAAGKAKRAANRESSPRLLCEAGISFETRNGGAHLVVGHYNFWPGTGRWSSRVGDASGFGVRNLIKRIQREQFHSGLAQ